MLNLLGRSSKCNSNSQFTSFRKLQILRWLSLIRRTSHLHHTAGDTTGRGGHKVSGGFMRSKPLSLATAVCNSASTTILFLMRKSSLRIISIWRLGQIMALSMHDFHQVSGEMRSSLQYCNKSTGLAWGWSETKAVETVNGLKSLQGMRPYSSMVCPAISTGEAPWSISAQIGDGAQVKGA